MRTKPAVSNAPETGRPRRHERLEFEALSRWFRASAPGASVMCALMNVDPEPAAGVEGFALALVDAGWHVYCRPRDGHGSDVDDELVSLLRAGHWRRAAVVSHDARAFREPLEELAGAGAVAPNCQRALKPDRRNDKPFWHPSLRTRL